MAKFLFYGRHGDKTKNDLITPECLKNIEKNGIPGVPAKNISYLCKGGELERTDQMREAFQKYLESQGIEVKKVFEKDPRFGTKDIFNRIAPEMVMHCIVNHKMGIYEAIKAYGPKDECQKVLNEVMEAILDVFKQMDEGQWCYNPGHSPQVDMILEDIAGITVKQINSLGNILIIQDMGKLLAYVSSPQLFVF